VFPNVFRLAATYRREMQFSASRSEPIAFASRFDNILKTYFNDILKNHINVMAHLSIVNDILGCLVGTTALGCKFWVL